MINRIKGIITVPKKEWEVIDGENSPHAKLFMGYVLPLSLIPAIAAFIGYGLIGRYGMHTFGWGLRYAIIQWVVMVGGVYLTAIVINCLAEDFCSKKNLDKAFSLVTYAYTPMFLGGIFYILPSLSPLAGLAGLYGLYLLYIGIQPMMKAPTEKNTTYFIVSLVAMLVVYFLLGVGLSAILITSAIF